MSDPIAGGKLFAIPFDLNRGNPERIVRLLDFMQEHHRWFAPAGTPEEARANAMWLMTAADEWKWEIWNAGQFAGMLLLSRVSPKVDALFHFTLLPSKESGVTLFSSRHLIWNFLGYVFEAFQLQRISVEIPESGKGAHALAHWYRQRLGFRFEGEPSLERLRKYRGITILDEKGAPSWVASQGSRRERAHWDGTKWADLLCLRITRDEYATRRALGSKEPEATGETSTQESLREPQGEASPIRANETAGASG